MMYTMKNNASKEMGSTRRGVALASERNLTAAIVAATCVLRP